MMRFPENTVLTVEDFNSVSCQEALADVVGKDYIKIWQKLAVKAATAIEAKNFAVGKLLWLFADLCSMYLNNESIHNPFSPTFAMQTSRTAMPEDLIKEDIEFLAEIAPKISDTKLRARVADVAWVLLKNYKLALVAIDAYSSLEISKDSWLKDNKECFDRAITLAKQLSKSAENRLEDLEAKVLTALDKTSLEEGFIITGLSNLLFKHRLGYENEEKVINKLLESAKYLEEKSNFLLAESYYFLAQEWYERLGDQEQVNQMIVLAAKSLVKEGDARLSAPSPSSFAAANFYSEAVHKYQKVPQKNRDAYDINNKIKSLRVKMNKVAQSSVHEMSEFATESRDITELVTSAINRVAGKNIAEAFLYFANLSTVKASKIKIFAEESLSKSLIQMIFGGTYISTDGRVVARSSALNSDNSNKDEVIWSQMISHYGLQLSLIVQGKILPALNIINQEHRITEQQIYSMVRNSPVIPIGRERIIAKGLYKGFDGDFISSIHILIPQLENLVRQHLKQEGEITTTLDANKIETENGLSTLASNPKIKKIFGDDFAFELKALFCDPLGPNLRNQIAHGLLDYEESQSVYVIYAWWVIFRLTFNTFWAVKKQRLANEAEE